MKRVIFDITSKCNLRCAHCYNAEKYFKSNKQDLSFEDCIKLIDKIVDSGYTTINILGGGASGKR